MLKLFIPLFLLVRTILAGEQLVFLEPPENFQPKLSVVGCFISVEERFLFLKQRPDDSEANAWGVPGGKLEKGETPEEGCIREVVEETGIDLKNTPRCFMGKVYIRYPEIDFVYYMYEVSLETFPEVIIDLGEHTEYRWLTLEEALNKPLIRGEAECIDLVYLK